MAVFRTHLVRTAIQYAFTAILVCALVLSCLFTSTLFGSSQALAQTSQSSTAATSETQRVVRVGYMDQVGMLTRDESGNYSGYTYDYLIQIAQFTGWTYEFIEAPGSTQGERAMNLIGMLDSGEVDIEGGMAYSSALASMYEYPKNSYGTTHTALFVPGTDSEVSQTNLYTQEVLRVALLASAKQRRAEITHFCEANNIALETIDCASLVEMKDKVLTGEADAFLDVDMNVHEGFLIASSFDARPYFFGAPKGQRAIVDEIDVTITRINESYPSLQAVLYEKYFNSSVSNFELTPQQAAFAQQHKTLRVGVIAEKAPLQSFNNQTGEFSGVSKGVLDYLSVKTGLMFEMVKIEQTDNIYQALRDNNIDIIAGVDNNLLASSLMGVSLTAPYVSTSIMLVYNRAVNPNDLTGLTLAVPWELVNAAGAGVDKKVYNSLEECFEAVNNGEADYAYGTSYSTPYYLSLNSLNNLLSLPTSTASSDICFGLVQPVEPELLVILNKSVRSFSVAELDSLLYSNSLVGSNERFDLFVREHLLEIALISISLLVAIIALLALYLRTRVKAARSARGETLRFQTLFSLANEQFFEYNISDDSLRISRPKDSLNSLKFINASRSTKNGEDESPYCIIQHAHAVLKETESEEILNAITAPEQVVTEGLSDSTDGSRQWIRITSNFVTDDDNRPISVIGKVTNIDDEMREKMDLSERAYHDGLTGLLNWKAFQEQANLLLTNGQAGAILAIDTDDFKDVNDTYGHLAGDVALQRTAEVIRSAFRPQDLVGRLGGDEFAVCIRGSISTENLARRCNAIIEKGVVYPDKDGVERTLTLSVGGVELEGVAIGFQHAYRQADEALYRAKADGKNRYNITTIDNE